MKTVFYFYLKTEVNFWPTQYIYCYSFLTSEILQRCLSFSIISICFLASSSLLSSQEVTASLVYFILPTLNIFVLTDDLERSS